MTFLVECSPPRRLKDVFIAGEGNPSTISQTQDSTGSGSRLQNSSVFKGDGTTSASLEEKASFADI